MNRPVPDLGAIEAALATLAEPAPPSLAHGALVAVGLADDYALIDSPVGPLRVAWNGRGVSAVESAADDHAFEVRFLARTGRRARPAGRASCRPRPIDRATARWQPSSPHRTRPPWQLRLRTGGLAEGARDPARRSPAVRLGCRGDRAAEGGPCRWDGARSQPGAAHRALPPGGAQRWNDRPVLAGRAWQQADNPGRGRPRSG